ncbi:MAG TPA: RNA polymerase sigma factor [Methylovirgula sp.]|nr:RNA polymerase sigma factor [Methylovirgula sp.]
MTDTSWAMLRELFVAKYDNFRKRLTRRLGSDDLARESLHEAYLQLSRTDAPAAVQRPESYLFRIALNVAAGQRRKAARPASHAEIEAALAFADETAETHRTVEARFELEALERAIEELPRRQKTIFLAARVRELPIQAIAESLGISRRLVELELKRALLHCAQRLDRQITQRSTHRQPKTSYSVPNDDELGAERRARGARQ